MKVLIIIGEIVIPLIVLFFIFIEGRGVSPGVTSSILSVMVIVYAITISVFSYLKKNK